MVELEFLGLSGCIFFIIPCGFIQIFCLDLCWQMHLDIYCSPVSRTSVGSDVVWPCASLKTRMLCPTGRDLESLSQWFSTLGVYQSSLECTHIHTHTMCVRTTGPQLSPIKSVSKYRTWTSVYLDILKAPQFNPSQSWESLAWTIPLSTGLGWVSGNNSSQQRGWEIFWKAELWENFSSLFKRGMWVNRSLCSFWALDFVL